ncbi:hypothetical protein FB451DRAFT_1493137 [Mycena latifolia]|nr:hypothetical protein FB451DRAFT_1493137 [Mycena latifolia]
MTMTGVIFFDATINLQWETPSIYCNRYMIKAISPPRFTSPSPSRRPKINADHNISRSSSPESELDDSNSDHSRFYGENTARPANPKSFANPRPVTHPTDSGRNPNVQATYPRKAPIEKLGKTVTKFQEEPVDAPKEATALPPPLAKLHELERENARLLENYQLRSLLPESGWNSPGNSMTLFSHSSPPDPHAMDNENIVTNSFLPLQTAYQNWPQSLAPPSPFMPTTFPTLFPLIFTTSMPLRAPSHPLVDPRETKILCLWERAREFEQLTERPEDNSLELGPAHTPHRAENLSLPTSTPAPAVGIKPVRFLLSPTSIT